MRDSDYELLAVTKYAMGPTKTESYPVEHWVSARTGCNSNLKAINALRSKIFLQTKASGFDDSVVVWEQEARK